MLRECYVPIVQYSPVHQSRLWWSLGRFFSGIRCNLCWRISPPARLGEIPSRRGGGATENVLEKGETHLKFVVGEGENLRHSLIPLYGGATEWAGADGDQWLEDVRECKKSGEFGEIFREESAQGEF